VLDDQTPAGLLWPPAVALQADYKLLKLGSRKHLGLSSHGHGFRTPLWGALWQLGESCHMRLDRDLPGLITSNLMTADVVKLPIASVASFKGKAKRQLHDGIWLWISFKDLVQ